MLVHGVWNLSPEGVSWWKNTFKDAYFLCYGVGVVEIIAGFGITLGFYRKQFAAILAILMTGALLSHLDQGYSFKNNGYETPLAYLLISLAILFEKVVIHEKEKLP